MGLGWNGGLLLSLLSLLSLATTPAAGGLPAAAGMGAAVPIWAASRDTFAMLRLRFNFTGHEGASTLQGRLVVTAAQTPLCDVPPCHPHGGTSAPKLLGAYKLFVNGILVGMGPGRNLNGTQALDTISVGSALRLHGENVVAVQCYHRGASPGFLMTLYVNAIADDGREVAKTTLTSGPAWRAIGADNIFNPAGSTGSYGQPHENIDMRRWPVGWSRPGFDDSGWPAAVNAKSFALPMAAKKAEPLALLWRPAQSVVQLPGRRAPSACGTAAEGGPDLILSCRVGDAVTGVGFASWGTPTGHCANGSAGADTFAVDPACHSPQSVEVVRRACLGRPTCSLAASNAQFGGADPCHRVSKHLSVHLECSKRGSLLRSGQHMRGQMQSRPWRDGSGEAASGELLHYVFDLGSEVQGGANITLDGGDAPGATVTVRLGETLLADGTVRVPMYTGNTFEDTWTLRQGRQTVTQHEYMEFRYIEVVGAPRPVGLADVGAWVVRYPLANAGSPSQRGDPLSEPFLTKYGAAPSTPAAGRNAETVTVLAQFSSADATLDRVWRFARYTVVTTGLDLNTDSNTRQRDLCHIDAYITCLGQYSVSNSSGVQWQTAVDALQPDSNIWDSSADFKMVVPLLLQEVILHRGDPGLRLVRQYYSLLKDFTLARFVNSSAHGLLYKPAGAACGFQTPTPEGVKCALSNLIDWPATARDGYQDGPVSTVINAYAVGASAAMGRIAGWLGEATDAVAFDKVSVDLAAAMRAQLYDPNASAFRDGLGVSHHAVHSSLFSAAHGVVSSVEMAANVTAFLQAQQQDRLRCSCMAAFWTLQGLYRMGEVHAPAADLAHRFLTWNSSSSWVNMMDTYNATATMEAWTPSEKPNLSFSHPWCSAPNSIIPRWLVGVRPTSPNWSEFVVSPQPSDVAAFNVSLPTPRGTIGVAFQQAATDVQLGITVPAGSVARVCLVPPRAGVAPELTLDGRPVPSSARGRLLCVSSPLANGTYLVVRAATTNRRETKTVSAS